MPFTALILSAGRSTRMGTAKAWLLYQNRPILQHIVDAAFAGGALAVVVVVGAEESDDDALVSRIDVAMRITHPAGARLSVAIGRPDATPIDSLRAGLELVAEGSDLLLWPVDAPFASATIVRSLAEALGAQRDHIALPRVGSHNAHPVLIGTRVVPELLDAAANSGADAVVRRQPERIVYVEATDPRIARAINTPEDARALGLIRA